MSSQARDQNVANREPAVPLQPVVDPADWRAPDLAASRAFLFELTEDHIEELDQAIQAVESAGLTLMQITRDGFSLPSLAPRLAEIRQEIVDGRGFVQMRGFPVHRYTRLQAAIAFWGVALHLGDSVISQNAKGHLLGHVTDIGQTNRNPNQRGPYSSDAIPFHVDCSDIVGLMCLHTAPRGGESCLASSIAVHNAILERRPDLLRVLAEPFYRDRRGEVPPGMPPWYRLAVFHYNQGYLSTTLEPHYTRSAERHEGVPKMTPEQHEAIEFVESVARELRLDIEFRPGDMQFLNNHVIMHARGAYTDDPDPARHRYLYRIWVSAPGCRPLPPAYFERHGPADSIDWPGGIVGQDTVLKAPLEPQ